MGRIKSCRSEWKRIDHDEMMKAFIARLAQSQYLEYIGVHKTLSIEVIVLNPADYQHLDSEPYD